MADQPIGGIKLEIAGDIRGLQKAIAEGKVSIEQLGQFLEQKLDKSTTSAERSVNRLVKELTGVRPSAQLQQLAVAVEKIGGTSKLTEVQVGNLQKKIEGLRSAGGNVPASLQGLAKSIEGVGAATDKLKTAGLQQLEGMSSRLGPLGGALSAIGPAGLIAAAGIGALGAAATGVGKIVMDAARWADGLQDVAAVLGTTWEATQRLQAGAAATGVDFNLLRDSIVKMQQAIVDAPEKLNNLGLSMDKLRSMAPEQQFEAIATQLQKIEDPARRNAIAMEIFGRKWADLVPFVEAGFEAMREATVVSDETVNGLGKISDAADKLKHNWDTLWNAMGGALGSSPAIVGNIEAITNALAGLSKEVSSGGLVSAAKWIALLSSGPGGFVNGVQMLADKGKGGSDPWGGWAPGMGALPSFNADGTIKRDEPVLGETETERKAREAREKEAARERQRMLREEEAALKRYHDAMNRARAAEPHGPAGGMGPLLSEGADSVMLPSRSLNRLTSMDAPLMTTLDFEKNIENLGFTSEQTAEALNNLAKEADKAGNKMSFNWDAAGRALGAVASMLGVGQNSALGRGIGGIQQGIGIGQDLKGAFGTAGNRDYAGMALAGVQGFTELRGQGGNVLGGAGTGASLGMQFGPQGAAIGALAGGLFSAGQRDDTLGSIARFTPMGLVGSLFGSKNDKRSSTGFEGVDSLIDRLSDGMERNAMSAADLGSAFDQAFGELVPNAIDKTTGLLSKNAEELIRVARSSGIASEAIKGLMLSQAQSLGGNLAGGLAGVKTSRESGGKGLASQGAASAIGTSIQGSFAEMVKGGMSSREAIEALAPAIRSFREELDAAGMSGGAAFEALEHRLSILTGEITGPLVAGVNGFAGALANMNNLGMLNQETFAGITEQIGANITALAEQGVTGPAAIMAMQPSLQTVWELQQKYGFTVDETTQAMIDQGVEAGLLGDKHKSADEQMVDGIKDVVSAIRDLTSALLGIPKKVDSQINVHTNRTSSGPPGGGGDRDGDGVPDESDGHPDDPLLFSGGSGGIRNFGRGTPAILHGWEGVFTAGQLNSMLTSAATAGASYSPTSEAGDGVAVIADRIDALRRDLREYNARVGDAFRDAVEQLPRR